MALSCGGTPPPEPQPPEQPTQPQAQPAQPVTAPQPAAPAAAAEASPDHDPQAVDHNCHLCEMLQTDCGKAGRGDCGALVGDCQQKCQAVKSASGSAKRGSPCSSDGECGAGLCCRVGKCGLNQMFYYPLSGQGQVGIVLQCQ
ncbi:MAG: hypothetical protein JRF63_07140 [Deltaproteobacteria bacterium]|nr:hypothetical protein [Deltaproteobacteria bacterium]